MFDRADALAGHMPLRSGWIASQGLTGLRDCCRAILHRHGSPPGSPIALDGVPRRLQLQLYKYIPSRRVRLAALHPDAKAVPEFCAEVRPQTGPHGASFSAPPVLPNAGKRGIKGLGTGWVLATLMHKPALSKADLTQSFVAHVSALWRSAGRPVVVGLCGAQGSGKSTLAVASQQELERQGMRTAVVALDDFYLPHEARVELSNRVHPLLLTRGVPGTHDTDMLATCLQQLIRPGFCDLPRFDKASDTRAEPLERIRTPVDIVLFEGWCVGARPQPDGELEAPVNRLEAEEDRSGVWRSYVQAQLAGRYRNLFASLDALALLKAPSFAVVFTWRKEQEDELRARTGRGMSDPQLVRFIAHYERLTRWILSEMPQRADWCFPLDERRHWRVD